MMPRSRTLRLQVTSYHSRAVSVAVCSHKSTLSQRGVVFLRNQDVSVGQQKILGQKLGELTGKPETSKVPFSLVALWLILISSSFIDTLWASGYEIYDWVSPPWQMFAGSLAATHHQPQFSRIQKNFNDQLLDGVRDSPEKTGPDFQATHSVARKNLVTGWNSLFSGVCSKRAESMR